MPWHDLPFRDNPLAPEAAASRTLRKNRLLGHWAPIRPRRLRGFKLEPRDRKYDLDMIYHLGSGPRARRR